ncbi:hypothetical protein N5079_20430 [Planotetraspora sp. A-T 1434]|uniref:hypothetical protein n=1 Tax=Planotetraspora sp. A-T 1434 TaxID=2979219 RepID=UPI0021BE4A57|nr:hypothetical protein [Planotetraspora sp. A-T 1434]MCT9932571.1 hypothetical protein [Planotetraspora sp. A-T 1434]
MSEMEPLDEVVEELPIEAPEADAVEQRQLVKVAEDNRWPEQVPFEADPADVAEQERTVDLGDDEDYR